LPVNRADLEFRSITYLLDMRRKKELHLSYENTPAPALLQAPMMLRQEDFEPILHL